MAIVLLLEQMLRHFRGCCKLLRSFLTYRLIMMIKFQVFYIAIPYLLAHHEAGISIQVLNSLLFRFYSFNSLCAQLNSSSQTVRKPSIKKGRAQFFVNCCISFCLDVHPCIPNPCLNDGQCSYNGNKTTCVCGFGFTGERCQGKLTQYELSNVNV